jgi:hypothetical protein
MNHVERFRAVMNFQPVDRLPRWEWAMWWDQTIARWHSEGLPKSLEFSRVFEIARYFGLDPYQPLMKTGGFVPSVDHQTPPGVSIDQYRAYLKLLFEYTVG